MPEKNSTILFNQRIPFSKNMTFQKKSIMYKYIVSACFDVGIPGLLHYL